MLGGVGLGTEYTSNLCVTVMAKSLRVESPIMKQRRAPEWFDVSLERRLERFSLALRRGGLPGGELRGVTRGGQLEFVEHRPYAVGDDLKWLDWNVYGRLGRLHVKTFAMEAATQVDVLIDGSASMALELPVAVRGGRGPGRLPRTPYEQALLVATCVAYLALRGGRKGSGGGHRVRPLISDARARGLLRWLPTRKGPVGFLTLLAELAEEPQAPAEAAASGRFAPAVEQALTRLGPNNLVVAVSDGYDAAALQPALARLATDASRRVVFVHLANEADPLGDTHERVEGALRLLDAETHVELTVEEVAALRNAYREAYASYLDGWRSFCARHGITYMNVQAGRDLPEQLLAKLHHAGVIA